MGENNVEKRDKGTETREQVKWQQFMLHSNMKFIYIFQRTSTNCGEAVTLMTCIPENTDSTLDWDSNYSDSNVSIIFCSASRQLSGRASN